MTAPKCPMGPGRTNSGCSPANTSMSTEPPVAVIAPTRMAENPERPRPTAFCAPTTAYRPSQTASMRMSALVKRFTRLPKKNPMPAATSTVGKYQGLASATGRTCSRMSRRMPPPKPAAMAKATNPVTANPRRTACNEPLSPPKNTANRSR